MPIYRHIQISFWQDRFILSLTPDERYFYLYLLTNSKTKQCGIYEIPLKIMKVETGFEKDKILNLIKKFEESKKIKYSEENSEMMIINWVKYNWSESNKVKKCILKELRNVKTKEYVINYYNICKEYGYSLDTPIERKRKTKSKRKNKDKEESDDREENSSKSNDLPLKKHVSNRDPLIDVARKCYMENGPICRLKKGPHDIEEKCKFCPGRGKT